jgi:hypothetical protein
MVSSAVILSMAACAVCRAQNMPWRTAMSQSIQAQALVALAWQQTPPASPSPAPAGPAGQGQPVTRTPRARQVYLAEIPVPLLSAALGLTEEQKAKVAEIRNKLESDLKSAAAVKSPGPEAERSRRAPLEQAHNGIEALLTEEQKKEALALGKKIGLMGFAGIPAGAIGDLNLTPDQVDKISLPITDALKNAASTMQGLQPSERVEKTKQILEGFRATANSVLTADQRQKLADYWRAHPVKQAAPSH